MSRPGAFISLGAAPHSPEDSGVKVTEPMGAPLVPAAREGCAPPAAEQEDLPSALKVLVAINISQEATILRTNASRHTEDQEHPSVHGANSIQP